MTSHGWDLRRRSSHHEEPDPSATDVAISVVATTPCLEPLRTQHRWMSRYKTPTFQDQAPLKLQSSYPAATICFRTVDESLEGVGYYLGLESQVSCADSLNVALKVGFYLLQCVQLR